MNWWERTDLEDDPLFCAFRHMRAEILRYMEHGGAPPDLGILPGEVNLSANVDLPPLYDGMMRQPQQEPEVDSDSVLFRRHGRVKIVRKEGNGNA